MRKKKNTRRKSKIGMLTVYTDITHSIQGDFWNFEKISYIWAANSFDQLNVT